MAPGPLDRDPVPDNASLIYAGTNAPLFAERAVLEPVFEATLAFGRLITAGERRFVDWNVGPGGFCDPGSPRLAAFRDDLARRLADAKVLAAELEKVLGDSGRASAVWEGDRGDWIQLDAEEHRRLAGVLRRKELAHARSVGVERARIQHAHEVLRKTIDYLSGSDLAYVADHDGAPKVVRWGYRVSDPRRQLPPPVLEHRIQVRNDTAHLVLWWVDDEAYGERVLETQAPGEDEWHEALRLPRGTTECELPIGSHHRASYALLVHTEERELRSRPVEVEHGTPPVVSAPAPLPTPEVALVVAAGLPDGEEDVGLTVVWGPTEEILRHADWVATIERRAGSEPNWSLLDRCQAADGALHDSEGNQQTEHEYRVRFESDESTSEWGYAHAESQSESKELPAPIVGVGTVPAYSEGESDGTPDEAAAVEVSWALPEREGHPDPSWDATVERRQGRGSGWQTIGICGAAERRFIDEGADREKSARYRVCFSSETARSNWGEASWNPGRGEVRRPWWFRIPPWIWWALTALLLIALLVWLLGLFFRGDEVLRRRVGPTITREELSERNPAHEDGGQSAPQPGSSGTEGRPRRALSGSGRDGVGPVEEGEELSFPVVGLEGTSGEVALADPPKSPPGAGLQDLDASLVRVQSAFAECTRLQSTVADLRAAIIKQQTTQRLSEDLSRIYARTSEDARLSGNVDIGFRDARVALSEAATSMSKCEDVASKDTAYRQLNAVIGQLGEVRARYCSNGAVELEGARQMANDMARGAAPTGSSATEVLRHVEAAQRAKEEGGDVAGELEAAREAIDSGAQEAGAEPTGPEADTDVDHARVPLPVAPLEGPPEIVASAAGLEGSPTNQRMSHDPFSGVPEKAASLSSAMRFEKEGFPVFQPTQAEGSGPGLLERIVWGVSVRVEPAEGREEFRGVIEGGAERYFQGRLETAGVTLRKDVYVGRSGRDPKGSFWVHLEIYPTTVTHSMMNFDVIPNGPRIDVYHNADSCKVSGALAHWWFGLIPTEDEKRNQDWAQAYEWGVTPYENAEATTWLVEDADEMYRVAFRAGETPSRARVELFRAQESIAVCAPFTLERLEQ